jgi:CO/xanthine dehydrogenase Mo-binding subunit
MSQGLSRRAFLELSAGALLVGATAEGCRPAPPPAMAEASRDGALMPNAWVRITKDDEITLFLDRVEMGQGTMTSHAMLVAEELEVDPTRIRVEHAVADRAYDNPDPALGFQITGGSTSVRTSWVPLRKAAASAREMLRRAAAERWRVDVASCSAVGGAIVHAASSRRVRYGELVGDASRLSVPSDPPLKDAKAFHVIGTSVPRLDSRAKVDGSAVFGIDVSLPDMLHAVVVRPETRGARVLTFDARNVEKQPGVVSVFEVPSGIAIVATRGYLARRAAKHLVVRWSEGPLSALDTTALFASYRRRAERPARRVRDDGSFDRAKKSATKTLAATYETPYLAHATMEPMNCTAHVKDGRCTIWAPTQSPGLARELVHQALGIPQDAITVHTTFLGGGFGRRLAQDYVVEAAHVARRVGRPVKVLWSREDDFANDFYRPAGVARLEATLDARGELTGWFHRVVTQSIVSQIGREWIGAMAPNGAPTALKKVLGRTATALYDTGVVHDTTTTEGASDFEYAIPNLRVELAAVEPGVPVGFWRAVGNSENVFVAESFLDEVAHAAGRDPYELRRALLAGAPRLRAVLDLAAEKAGWPRAGGKHAGGSGGPAARPSSRGTERGIHRGIAAAACFGSFCAQVAEVSMEGGKPRVVRVVAAVDCGRVVNPDLARAQIESGIVFGLSAAMKQQVTFERGVVRETNFHRYDAIRMAESPAIEVHFVESDAEPTGVGEPGLPPIAPAVANAIFAATGRRIRTLPIERALSEGA